MTEPMSDALFGVDGTELPRLYRDPTGRDSWSDVSVPPPVPLPAIPELNMTREAIAAALGDDPGGPGAKERPAAAGSPPAAAAPTSSQTTVTAPSPAASAPSRQGPPAVSISPAQSPQRGPGGPGYVRSLSTKSLPRVTLRSSRRRAGHPGRGLPTQIRSNGGAGAFFVVMVIVFAVLLYFIVSGIVESFARLIP